MNGAVSRQHRGRAGLPRVAYYAVSGLLAAVFLFPIAWTILTSLKPRDEANASPPTFLPTHIAWEIDEVDGDDIGRFATGHSRAELGHELCIGDDVELDLGRVSRVVRLHDGLYETAIGVADPKRDASGGAGGLMGRNDRAEHG